MNERDALLILNVIPKLGQGGVKKLLECYNPISSVFNASTKELREIEGIDSRTANNILDWSKFIDIKAELRFIEKNNISIVTIKDIDYPVYLKEIYDPPVVLYIKGEIIPDDEMMLAVVGARKASSYGINTARNIARQLAEHGITVVSGLARGVDTAAHTGALEGNGRTIAVLGSGINKVYPKENLSLAGKISQTGAVVSEFQIGMDPKPYNFPKRNRIISGLCKGVIVIEAGKYSGSLITARMATEQGREVFSIPGRIDELTSYGTNFLIKNGAKTVVNIEDILEEFPEYKTNRV